MNPAGTRGPMASDDYELDRGDPGGAGHHRRPGGRLARRHADVDVHGRAAGDVRVPRRARCDGRRRLDRVREPGDVEPQPRARCRVHLPRPPDRPGGQHGPRRVALLQPRPHDPGRAVDRRPPAEPRLPIRRRRGSSPARRARRSSAVVTRGPDVVSDWADCTSPRDFDLVERGRRHVHLPRPPVQRGGTRSAEATDDYVLDVAPPPAPVITGAPGAIGNGSDPQWSFTAEAGATTECQLERGAGSSRDRGRRARRRGRTGSWASPTATTRSRSARSTPPATPAPAATDNHSVDRVPPAPPAVDAAPGPLGRDATPSWTFTAEAGADVRVHAPARRRPGRAARRLHEPDRRTTSPAGATAATASASARRDAAGNAQPGRAPPPTCSTRRPGRSRSSRARARSGATAGRRGASAGEEGASFECRLSLSDVAGRRLGPVRQPARLRPRRPVRRRLRVRAARDRPGGQRRPRGSRRATSSTPRLRAAPTIDRRPESPGSDATPSWRFSGERDATFSCRVERAAATTVLDWTLCASPFSADLAHAGVGTYRFLVRATDLPGTRARPPAGEYVLQPEPEPRAQSPNRTPSRSPSRRATRPAGPRRRETGSTTAGAAPSRRSTRRTTPRTRLHPPASRARRRARTRRTKPARKPAPRGRLPRRRSAATAVSTTSPTEAVKDVARVITKNPDKSVFPFSLLLLVARLPRDPEPHRPQ